MPLPLSRPAPSPGQWGAFPDAADTVLLDFADPDPHARVVLIGPNRLEMMCALIRRGSLDVATLRLSERPELACADLVVVANVTAPDALAVAAGHARRALAPLGSLVVGLPPDPGGQVAVALTLALRRLGFAAIRTRGARPTMLRAEVPMERLT